LRDFPEEPAMLHSIHDLMKLYNSIISFNGKSFDLPLLKSRFIFHRIKTEFAEPVHLDLLHAARRVWKNSLPDCNLSTLEHQVLKVYRDGDVPSYLIPHLYFEYLRTKDARPMKQIFYHNEIDILSMVTLTVILHHIHKSPLQQLSNKTDLTTLAKHYENMQKWEKNIAIYKALIGSEKNAERKKELGIKLGYCYKRSCQWEQAERLWLELIKQGNFRIEPFEELVKYYEHRVRNLKQAEQVVQTALDKINVLEQLHDNSAFSLEKESLLYRLNRIQRKLNE
ncbi:MAG: ribonuclease H-like domain-containing protein, partial [Bacteroidales bacterium]|nr:ribonuclease H-like domain-containing protein [Bacteroidales bacterium]